MTRITKIERMVGCGIFRNFTWPSLLPEFGRYNLIYGWNGTGKTTLSQVLRCLEKRTVPEGQVKIEIEQNNNKRSIQGNDFPSESLMVRVFNREFIAASVFPVEGGDLPPIFVLGEENVDKQREVGRLKSEQETAQSRLDSANVSKVKADHDFDHFCSERAKAIKEKLRSSGQNPYNNYNKTNFQEKAQSMADAGDGATHRLDDAEREKLFAQCCATQKQKLRNVTYSLPNFQAILARLSEHLATTVVSMVIESLKDDPALAEWTREGLRLHRDRKAEQCLFCEQQMPKSRLESLKAHFSDQYDKFIQGLDQFIGELQELLKTASDLQLPNKEELYGDLAADFETEKAGLSEALKATRTFLDAAVRALKEKRHRAFEQISVTLQPPQLDSEAVEKLNMVILRHNQACDAFNDRVKEAREKLAFDMVAEALEEFVRLQEIARQAESEVQEAKQNVQRLKDEIAILEREIVEHRQPAEELNEELRKYLGHDEIRLEIKDTGYAITRGGQTAQALSEGEKMAIALLYFLKSLKDKGFNLANGIVVLDDPVSSLDANALYLAFGFIRDRTENSGQLIILTHNFSFFRLIINWFSHLDGQKKHDVNKRPARFFMIECLRDEEGRYSEIRKLDPLLKCYESEYQYLFACVYRAAQEKSQKELVDYYGIPNMARRVLETFLSFHYPGKPGDLWKKLKKVSFDEAKKTRILRFLHTHSHSNNIGEPEHDISSLSETPQVLSDLLELIRLEDEKHYNAMESIIPKEESMKDE